MTEPLTSAALGPVEEDSRKLVRSPRGVRSLAYLALLETRPNLHGEPNMWDALRGVFHAACLLFGVFHKVLGSASSRTLM